VAADNDDVGDRLLTLAEVEAILSLKKSKIYSMIAAGEFPAALKIGGATRWSSREVVRWIEALKASPRARSPTGSAHR
jgi:predicted DNA-binding transcriptional regulator AlpA